jgi:hypothetical protein
LQPAANARAKAATSAAGVVLNWNMLNFSF